MSFFKNKISHNTLHQRSTYDNILFPVVSENKYPWKCIKHRYFSMALLSLYPCVAKALFSRPGIYIPKVISFCNINIHKYIKPYVHLKTICYLPWELFKVVAVYKDVSICKWFISFLGFTLTSQLDTSAIQ